MPILANNNYYPLKQFRNAGVTDFRGSEQRDTGKETGGENARVGKSARRNRWVDNAGVSDREK